MNDLPCRLALALRIFRFPLFLIVLMVTGVLTVVPPNDAAAHAELVRAEPPVDGLVVAPPTQLRLFFTEAIATSDPAPSVRVLDENGVEKQATVLPEGSDKREVVVDVKDLDNGTWTVAWTVKSADDGHILSGTYAFRIGGGLPPGVATVEGEQPQAWAVATRWLTFLGAAIAGAGFLFGLVMFPGGAEPLTSSRRRTRLILIGGVLALLATASEPVLQVVFPVEGVDVTIGSAIRGLPDGWWFRPIALAALVVLAVVVAYPLRGRIALVPGLLGGGLALAALLGLSLTSHAVARDTWRPLAIASDTVHQWSTALWVGGLASLLLWWTGQAAATRTEGEHPAGSAPVLLLRRFSAIALWLFVIAVITGVLNAGLVFPVKQTTLWFGLGTADLPAISKLWSSDYGVVLLIKVLVLLIPFGLAAYHHRLVARAAKRGLDVASSVLRKTLRLETIVVCAVVLGGSILALSAPPTISQHALDKVVLAEFARPDTGDPTTIVHLTVDPASQGQNSLTLRLTDLQGEIPPASEPAARIALSFTSLNHGTTRSAVSVQPTDLTTATYAAEGLDLSLSGWWRVQATVERDTQPSAIATFYLLLPDPNVHGFGAPPSPKSDPAAEDVFNRGMQALTSLTAIRRTEAIGSGRDALVYSDYAWTTGANGHPPSFESQTLYSASFVPLPDGSSPMPPRINAYHSVTIDGTSWQISPDGQWQEQSPIIYQPPSEWNNTYSGAQSFQLGMTETVDGEECQIVTFHTPESSVQAQAWFAWWVGKDSGLVRRTTMVANQHYMIWEYRDFNGDFVIQGPPAPAGTPEATPLP